MLVAIIVRRGPPRRRSEPRSSGEELLAKWVVGGGWPEPAAVGSGCVEIPKRSLGGSSGEGNEEVLEPRNFDYEVILVPVKQTRTAGSVEGEMGWQMPGRRDLRAYELEVI